MQKSSWRFVILANEGIWEDVLDRWFRYLGERIDLFPGEFPVQRLRNIFELFICSWTNQSRWNTRSGQHPIQCTLDLLTLSGSWFSRVLVPVSLPPPSTPQGMNPIWNCCAIGMISCSTSRLSREYLP
jgi:hypothetical protein